MSKHEDAFPPILSSLTPQIPSMAHTLLPPPLLHADLRARAPCSEGWSECSLIRWSSMEGESLRYNDRKSIVSRSVVLFLVPLFRSIDQFICPWVSRHYGFVISLLSGKTSSLPNLLILQEYIGSLGLCYSIWMIKF